MPKNKINIILILMYLACELIAYFLLIDHVTSNGLENEHLSA